MNSISWKENKQKFQNFVQTLIWEHEGEKYFKTFFEIIERHNMPNWTISKLYANDQKPKYSSSPNDVLKPAKTIDEKLYAKDTTSKTATFVFLTKFPTGRKSLFNNFTFRRLSALFAEITKSVDKLWGANSLTSRILQTLFYFLNFFNFLEKLRIMGVSSRAGVISVINKKISNKVITNYIPISRQSLDYKIYAANLKNHIQKPKMP